MKQKQTTIKFPKPTLWTVERDSHDADEYFTCEGDAIENACMGLPNTSIHGFIPESATIEQAEENKALMAHVERLRAELEGFYRGSNTPIDYELDYGSRGVRDIYRERFRKILIETPSQSLEQVRAEERERCINACKDEEIGTNKNDSKEDRWYDHAVFACVEAIRNLEDRSEP